MANTTYQTDAARNRYYAGRSRDATNFEIGQSRSRADQRIASVGARYGLMSDAISNIGQTLTSTIGNYYQFRAKQDTMALQLAQEGRAFQLDMLREQRMAKQSELEVSKLQSEIYNLDRMRIRDENNQVLTPLLGELLTGINTGEDLETLTIRKNKLSELLRGHEKGTVDPVFLSQFNAAVDTMGRTLTADVNGTVMPLDQAVRKLDDDSLSPSERVDLFNSLRNNPRLGATLSTTVKSFRERATDPKLQKAFEIDDQRSIIAAGTGRTKEQVYQAEQDALTLAKEKHGDWFKAMQEVSASREQAAKTFSAGLTTPEKAPAPVGEFKLPIEAGYRKFTIGPDEYPQFAESAVATGMAATRALGQNNQDITFRPGAKTALSTLSIGPSGWDTPTAFDAAHTKVSEISDGSLAKNYSPIVPELAKTNPNMTLQHAAVITTVDDLVKVMGSTSSPVEFKKALDLLDGTIAQAKVVSAKSRMNIPGIGTEVLTESQVKAISDRAVQMGVGDRIKPLTDWLSDYRIVSPKQEGNPLLDTLTAAPATPKRLGSSSENPFPKGTSLATARRNGYKVGDVIFIEKPDGSTGRFEVQPD